MINGDGILPVAEAHQGERYVLGARAPMNNAEFRGPWDCAEFVSWCVYQTYGVLFGVRPANPQTADAYTGYWTQDALAQRATVDVGQALRTPGGILLRRPRANGNAHAIGHIAISRGDGSTIEARGRLYGVVIAANAASRPWDYGVLIPGVDYASRGGEPFSPPTDLLILTSPPTRGASVAAVQRALAARGYSPGPIDGAFGPATEAAVFNFQASEGVATDGVVGPETASLLGLSWPIAPSDNDSAVVAAAERHERVRLEALVLRGGADVADGDARPANAGAPQAEMEVAVAAHAATAAGAADIVGFERIEVTPGRFEQFTKLADGSRLYLASETSYTDDMPRRGLYQPAKHFKDIEAAGRYDRHAAMAQHKLMAQIIWPTAVAESNGYHARLNCYDRAAFTYGFYQAAAHTPNENLIVLFRRLLALPSASRYFPDLTLVADNDGVPRVHRRRSDGSLETLETARKVTRPNGVIETQIPDFMHYLNADPTAIDVAENTAAARLFLWLRDEPDARSTQIRHAVTTAAGKIRSTMQKVSEFTADAWREVIWVNDIRHQGRGGFKAIAAAYQQHDVLETLAAIGADKHPERVKTVRDAIRTLEAEGVLSGWTAKDLPPA